MQKLLQNGRYEPSPAFSVPDAILSTPEASELCQAASQGVKRRKAPHYPYGRYAWLTYN
ncbi:hypothetical protein FHS20_001311 [Phyllobacterium endophyticum]|nr:hypothetical protein [Phyllobacterium endophyticum]